LPVLVLLQGLRRASAKVECAGRPRAAVLSHDSDWPDSFPYYAHTRRTSIHWWCCHLNGAPGAVFYVCCRGVCPQPSSMEC
jgi:hypothetical protein